MRPREAKWEIRKFGYTWSKLEPGRAMWGTLCIKSKCEKNNTAERKLKENGKRKRQGGEEVIVFFQCTMYPSPSLWTQGLRTCLLTSAHMFLLLHDRLWRKYRKTVSVCALGGGRERRGWSNTDKAAIPTMSSTFS